MNKIIKLALTILLIATVLFNSNVFAKGKKKPQSICSIFSSNKKLDSIITKGYFKNFSHATGKLILLGQDVADGIKIDSIISPKSITKPGNNSGSTNNSTSTSTGGSASNSTGAPPGGSTSNSTGGSNSNSTGGSVGNNTLLNNEVGFYKGNDASIAKKKTITLKGTHIGSIINLNGIGTSKGYSLTLNAPEGFCVDSKRRSSSLISSIVSLSFTDSGSNTDYNIDGEIVNGSTLVGTRRQATITGKITTGKGEGRFIIKLK